MIARPVIATAALLVALLTTGCGDGGSDGAETTAAAPTAPIAGSLDEVEQRFLAPVLEAEPEASIWGFSVGEIDTPSGDADGAATGLNRVDGVLMAELDGVPDGDSTSNTVTAAGVLYPPGWEGADAIAHGLWNVIDPSLSSDSNFTTAFDEFVSSNGDNIGAAEFFTGLGAQSRTLYLTVEEPYDSGGAPVVVAFSGPFTTEQEAADYVEATLDGYITVLESTQDCCASPDDADS